MDELLTDNVTALAAAGAIRLERVGQSPHKWLVDGGFPTHEQFDAVAEWRQRMDSPEAKEIYKRRAATAELVNARARNRGLLRMPVRGMGKVRSVVGLLVLAHNLLRTAALAPHLIGWGTTPTALAPTVA